MHVVWKRAEGTSAWTGVMLNHIKNKIRGLTSDKKFSEVLTGSAFAFFAQVAATGVTLLSNVIVARIYGAGAVGVLAVVNSFLALATVFIVMGTSTSVLRLIPEHTVKHSITSAYRVYRKIQYFVAGISLVVAAVFLFGASFVATVIFSKPHLASVLALSAVFLFFTALMDLNTQAVRGLRMIHTFTILRVIPSVAMLSVLIVLTLLFRSPTAPVYAQLSAFAVTAVVGVWLMDRTFRGRMKPGDVVQPMSIQDILSVSLPMMLTSSLPFIASQSGVIIRWR
jgi:O-antigen/teichoic acid export membrane protein